MSGKAIIYRISSTDGRIHRIKEDAFGVADKAVKTVERVIDYEYIEKKYCFFTMLIDDFKLLRWLFSFKEQIIKCES